MNVESRLLHPESRFEIAEILTAGHAIKSYDDYCRYVGEFRALKQVVDVYSDEVNTQLNQR